MNRPTRTGSATLLIFLSIVIALPAVSVSGSITCSSSQSPLFNICGPIQNLSGLNLQSSIVQAKDGTLRLAWTHFPLVGSATIYYASRLANGTWQAGTSITNLAGQNEFPSIVQLSNGTIFVFWAYKPAGSLHYQIYSRHLKGTVWSPYALLPLANPTPLNENDTQPSGAVGRDGTLWLFWVRDNSTASGSTPVMRQLWYETLNSTGWSKNEQPVTALNDANWNLEPSVMVGTDGIPKVVFARGQSSLNNFQINLIQRSGSGWTVPRSIVMPNSNSSDTNPSLVQDRNGTIWLFWMRDILNLSIMSEYSWDNGQTWRGVAQLTAACSGCNDSEYPAAVQSTFDNNLLVMFSTPSGSSFILDALVTVNPIWRVHHVSISISPGTYGSNASQVCGNYIGPCDYAGGFYNSWPNGGGPISLSPVVQFYLTVQNTGDFNETVTVTVAATNTTNVSLGSQTVSLAVGNSQLLTFNFNTNGVRPARYGFTANATIPVETLGNRGDSVLSKTNMVHLFPLGDVDQDGSVTLTDVSVVFYNYNCGPATGLCLSRYNAWADPSGQGVINLVDVGIVSKNFDTFT